MANKKAVELEGLGRKLTAEEIPASATGVAGKRRIEPQPLYVKAECEKVIADSNGSYIVLGRDRPSTLATGYGGAGHTQCSRIDLVVGRMAADGPKTIDKEGQPLRVHPSFESDAARIYISQKADIDHKAYFNLAKGKVGSSIARSAIGIKADAVRIVGREGIKLITRTEPRNSQTGKIEKVFGIDLIAGNDDKELEPLVKGHKLSSALKDMMTHIEKLNSLVNLLVTTQMQFNKVLTYHTHIGNMGAPTAPPALTYDVKTFLNQASKTSMDLMTCQTSLMSHRARCVIHKKNHYEISSPDYINSRYNNAN